MKYLFILCSFLGSLSAWAQGIMKTGNRQVVFKDVNVVAMDSDSIHANKTVVVQNGKVISVSAASNAVYPKGAVIVEGKGRYLMPGLAEMHAHVPPVDNLEPMKETLLLFAVNGVTTIRGMLGHPRHLELRAKIRSGEIPGPHFYTSGPSFNGNTVQNEQQAATRVKEQEAAGYDFLKLHPGLKLQNFDAVVSAAQKAGIPFAGHVSYDVGIWRAIEAGYATVDHMDGFVEALVPGIESIPEQQRGLFATFIGHRADSNAIPKLVSALKENTIWVVPTQALAERWLAPVDPVQLAAQPEMVYVNKKTLDDWISTKQSLLGNPAYKKEQVEQFLRIRRKLIYEVNKAGLLLLGSDGPQVFNVPGFSVHHELQYLVDAGLTPYEAIKTGTVNVGRFYKNPLMGTIREGAPADLVLLSANPLTDIKNTKSIEGVLIGSTWFSKQAINEILQKLNKK